MTAGARIWSNELIARLGALRGPPTFCRYAIAVVIGMLSSWATVFPLPASKSSPRRQTGIGQSFTRVLSLHCQICAVRAKRHYQKAAWRNKRLSPPRGTKRIGAAHFGIQTSSNKQVTLVRRCSKFLFLRVLYCTESACLGIPLPGLKEKTKMVRSSQRASLFIVLFLAACGFVGMVFA